METHNNKTIDNFARKGIKEMGLLALMPVSVIARRAPFVLALADGWMMAEGLGHPGGVYGASALVADLTGTYVLSEDDREVPEIVKRLVTFLPRYGIGMVVGYGANKVAKAFS